jgi:uncharacterized protein YndB with AHSA1/START domain
VSRYDELAAWFVAPMEFKEVGQRFEAMGQGGEVLRCEPPRALEWEWGGEPSPSTSNRMGTGLC